ncbi:MAG: hypothetical protein CVT88_02630 [Candidatus Altiarchaeales archaeon HGW-Altiarchaeales-1]|nr:MAG: hypothetical protein CVT89_08005 [Candidatus Altiarchaeales archaeon HGW-Altiarchaeales-2]PKP60589.1 MAG: hypothetical protein CVT88_02630 [Candidatus Altiarchaeales archaeon HGW-Altiarchaeales-1]
MSLCDFQIPKDLKISERSEVKIIKRTFLYDKKFEILGEAYLSLGNDIAYFSDTGRNWGNKYKVKDFNVNLNSNTNKDIEHN